MAHTEQQRTRWNCHDHREELCISNAATVYHPEHGQLCYVERHWDLVLYYPIEFIDKATAQRWIERGTIAELQEAFSFLGIGFSTKCFESRP